MAVGKICKWGNSLAIRVPKSFKNKLDIKQDDMIELSILRGGLYIKPIEEEPIDLLLLKDVIHGCTISIAPEDIFNIKLDMQDNTGTKCLLMLQTKLARFVIDLKQIQSKTRFLDGLNLDPKLALPIALNDIKNASTSQLHVWFLSRIEWRNNYYPLEDEAFVKYCKQMRSQIQIEIPNG